MNASLIWFLVGIAFLLAELAAPGLILMFFGIGALVAAIAAYFGAQFAVQTVIFLAASLSSLLLMRRWFAQTFRGLSKQGNCPEETCSALGQKAVVTQRICPPHPGEIKFRGSFWRAVADGVIEPETVVEIVAQATADGLTFRVAPVQPDKTPPEPAKPQGG